MNFSKRTEWDTDESELARALKERHQAGLPVADLTASNPTRCGFDYPADLLRLLTDTAALDYDPNPMGSLTAREAVCRYYRDLGVSATPERIILTTSTSEAYGYLFKLLLDPGDSILAPQPSYPLFDFLARVESVGVIAAPFVYDHGWQLDLEGLRRQITPGSRAVVLVHPNNPTGHFTKRKEAERLAAICREHGLALIVDEVFLDYGLASEATQSDSSSTEDCASFAARELGVLTFIVSGISKICGLPQMKVAWLLAAGPGSNDALARLEVVADTYLSMNAPVQLALPSWLAGRGGMQMQIRERVRGNLEELDRALADRAADSLLVNRLKIEGGWYAVLRVPATQPDELTVRELLELGVLIHPGYFFGMAESGWLVASLLTQRREFSLGTSVLLGYFHRKHESYLRGPDRQSSR